jgi:hypothetical protein
MAVFPGICGCTDEQMATIVKATFLACSAVQRVLEVVETRWNAVVTEYGQGASLKVVIKNREYYTKLLSIVNQACNSSKTRFQFSCKNAPECEAESKPWAFVREKGGEITICPQFWKLGLREQAAKIWHEFGRVFHWDELNDDNNFMPNDIRIWDKLIEVLNDDYKRLMAK